MFERTVSMLTKIGRLRMFASTAAGATTPATPPPADKPADQATPPADKPAEKPAANEAVKMAVEATAKLTDEEFQSLVDQRKTTQKAVEKAIKEGVPADKAPEVAALQAQIDSLKTQVTGLTEKLKMGESSIPVFKPKAADTTPAPVATSLAGAMAARNRTA